MPYLPREFVAALQAEAFWSAILDDRDLFPEYRSTAKGPAISVYYRGATMLRELSLVQGHLEASCHLKYLPIESTEDDAYIKLIADPASHGLVASSVINPIPFGDADPEVLPDVLRRFKLQVAAHNNTVGLEGDLVHALCKANLVVDQEIALPGLAKKSDRPDLAIAYPLEPRVRLVEVKRAREYRVKATKEPTPPVVDQVRRYADAIERHEAALRSRFSEAVQAKQQLGIGGFDAWSCADEPIEIDRRVTLAIGGCDRQTVSSVNRGEGEWEWVKDESLTAHCDVVAFGSTRQLFPG